MISLFCQRNNETTRHSDDIIDRRTCQSSVTS